MIHDLQFAVRMLIKNRWFTLVAVLALGLGIGLNATVFTFVNAVLIRGLPFDGSHEIFHVGGRATDTGNNLSLSYADFEEYRGRSRAFSELAAYRSGSFTVTESGRPPERIQGGYVTANTFSLLRQQALLGRTFVAGEDKSEAAPTVIIGYGVWQARYGSDPNVIGRAVKVNEVTCTIIGVIPEGVKFPNNAEMWRPLVPDADELTRRGPANLNLVGRLAAGADRRQADIELNGIASQIAQQHPETNKNVGAAVLTFNERFNGGPIRAVFLALLGAVGFVLLIACANVANLQIARSAARGREVAVRFALGASRARVVRQLLVESVLLASIGGLFGLGLAKISIGLFDAAVADTGKPWWIQFTFDPIVFGYFAAICLATGIVFGLAPALQVSRTNVNEVLKEGGRGSSGAVRARRLVSAMVVAELTLTVVLLVGAGLMIRSFLKMYSFNLGVETRSMLALRVQLPSQKYPEPEQRRLFFDGLLARLQTIPGMQSATIATAVPFGGSERRRIEIDGRPVARPEEAPLTAFVAVSPSYLDVMDLQVRRGRNLRESDGAPGSEVALVNERFAAQFLPDEDVVGKRIRMYTGGGQGRPMQPGPWLTVVGVMPTIRQGNPQSADPDAVVYQPYRMDAPAFMNILTRSQVPAATLTPQVREAVQAVDPDLPVFNVQTMDEVLAQGRWPYRVFGTMFSIFAFIALVLSAVGIYSMTAYSVTQRTPEIGVRMALGAQAGQVSWLILRRGLVQLAIGLTLGTILAYFASTALQSLVVQISARDPVTFATIAGVLIVVTMAACLVPARRATRLDPVAALRSE
jgi:predicted permease